jgi:hypothetical protein
MRVLKAPKTQKNSQKKHRKGKLKMDTTTEPRVHAYPEGKVATLIERQTAKLPSDLFLWAAGASIVGSLVLKLTRKDHESLFVGQWAPTFLLLGIYNKMVKLMGSD